MMWKWVSKALKTAGIKELKYTPMKSGWLGGKFIWGGFYKVQANKRTDVLPITVDKKGNVHLNVSPKKFIIGKIGKLPQVVKNLKDFKKTDLDIHESVFVSKLRQHIRQEIREVVNETRSINVEPNWEGMWRFFKHMAETNPSDWKKMKRTLGSDWLKIDKMAQQKGWKAESVNERVASPFSNHLRTAQSEVEYMVSQGPEPDGDTVYDKPKQSIKFLQIAQRALGKVT